MGFCGHLNFVLVKRVDRENMIFTIGKMDTIIVYRNFKSLQLVKWTQL